MDGLPINKKRVVRLLRTHGLLVNPNARLKATRTPTRGNPRPTAPNHSWGIDMTKGLVKPVGWVSLVLVLDWYTQKIVGHYAGLHATAAHWLRAVGQGLAHSSRRWPQGQGLSLVRTTAASRRRWRS